MNKLLMFEVPVSEEAGDRQMSCKRSGIEIDIDDVLIASTHE